MQFWLKKEVKIITVLLRFFRVYPWAIPTIIILGVLSSLAEGIGIGLFIPFLQNWDQGAYPSTGGIRFVEALNRLFLSIPPENRLFIIALSIFGSVLLKSALHYGNMALFTSLNQRIGHHLRSNIFQQLLTVEYSFLERQSTGRLMNTLTTESWRTGEALTVLVNLIIFSCTLAVYITLLLLLSWKLTLLVSAAILFISFLVRLLNRRAKNLGKEVTRINSGLADRMVEGIEGMKVIRAFGRESYEKQRFDRTSARLGKLLTRVGIINDLVHPIYEVLAAALLVCILLITFRSTDNLATLLVFIFVLYRLQPKVKDFDRARIRLISLGGAVEDVNNLLSREDKPYQTSGSNPFMGLETGIYFNRVAFRYNPTDGPVLKDISLLIPAGKTTAIVGTSGAGKSTLIKLILRLYDCSAGNIFIDGLPLRDMDLSAWRGKIALVSQDVYIFNTTVRENIAYGYLGASDAEIESAARQADAYDFIQKFPEGFNTIVGERGVRLSGGQQQRISLARAIVRNPDVLILDEATNALDSISESLIQTTLGTFGKGRTVIVIAHRLSTIECADHIIVLEDGQAREQGKLQELLEREGLFARLYRIQSHTILK